MPDNPFHQSLYNSLRSRLTSLCLAAVRKPGLDLRSHEISHLKLNNLLIYLNDKHIILAVCVGSLNIIMLINHLFITRIEYEVKIVFTWIYFHVDLHIDHIIFVVNKYISITPVDICKSYLSILFT